MKNKSIFQRWSPTSLCKGIQRTQHLITTTPQRSLTISHYWIQQVMTWLPHFASGIQTQSSITLILPILSDTWAPMDRISHSQPTQEIKATMAFNYGDIKILSFQTQATSCMPRAWLSEQLISSLVRRRRHGLIKWTSGRLRRDVWLLLGELQQQIHLGMLSTIQQLMA